MDDDGDGWGDFEAGGGGGHQEVDFALAQAESAPAACPQQGPRFAVDSRGMWKAQEVEPEKPESSEPKEAVTETAEKKSEAVGWGSLMNFGQALLAEASHALTEPDSVDSPDDTLRAEFSSMLHRYQHMLEDIYRQHNPEKLSDIPKLINRFKDQAETVDDLASFKLHCEEKMHSFHQAVCKKYGLEEEEHPIRAAIVAIYEKHNPAKLSNIDQLLTKFKGKEPTLYKSICEKYGVEPDSRWVEEEEEEPKTDSHWGGGFFGGGGLGALGGALKATSALQSLQSAAEGLQGLREKVERSFDEALADRGEMHDSANDQTATAAKPGSEEKAHQKEIETEEQEDEMTDETLHKQQEQLEQKGLQKQKAERLEREQAEQEGLEQEKLEQERLEQQRLEAEREEQERLQKEKEEAERLEREREEQERLEQEKLEQERMELQRLEAEREEQERLQKEKEEAEEAERLEREQAEQERLEQEKLEQERLEQQRLEAEREEQERLQKEKEEAEEAERLEREREEQERLEQEKLEQERLEQQRLEAEREEQERLQKEKEETERLEREREEQERLEQEKLEQERLEQQRLEAEREEQERLQKEKEEAERLEREREEQRAVEHNNPFDDGCHENNVPSALTDGSNEASPSSEARRRDQPEAANKALELLAEYEVRVKAVYQKHNPDALSDQHLDQILGKYREQILSRPGDSDQPEVLERYRERLESLYQAICARYEDAKPEDLRAMYTRHITAIYREHNPTKLSEVDKLIDKYSEQLPVLYQSICQKYEIKPSPELENEAKGEIQSTAESKPLWGASFLTSGLQTLKTLHGAAEGIRQHMEQSFEEAIRSEEEISTMQVVQGLSKAAEKGAAKAEMKSKEAAPLQPTALSDTNVASEGAVDGLGDGQSKAVVLEGMQELEQLRADKERLQKENRNLKAEKENLIMEGTKMSRRVQSVEERMKVMTSDCRKMEEGSDELERKIEKLNAQLARQTARAEKAEAQCSELKAESRKTSSELERAKQQLQGEKRQMQADQQALQVKTRESTEKERRMEERLQQLCHERDELRATSSSLTVELQQALGAVDNLERRLQQQIQETEQLQEQHRRQLEAAEYEFVNESMPYQQRLGEMEAQLAHQEQKFLEREAIAYRERDKERAELEAAKEELRQREALQERRARELHEESLRAQMAHEEAAQLRSLKETVQSAREAADRSREAAEGELRLESARRKSAEQRGDDLQQQVDKLQTSATGPGFGSSETEVQLRMQVSCVTQQRDTLQQIWLSNKRFPLILAVELRQLFAAMADCNCCNSLGSSPAFQLLLSIAVVILFLLIGIYGISIIILSNWDLSGFDFSDEWQSAADFYVTSQDLAYWFGAIVGVLWLIAICSRCCAPCCCQLSDVQCPCSPCKTFHMLDAPFFIGVLIAVWPVNMIRSQRDVPWTEDNNVFHTEGFILFTDAVLVIGLLILLVAIPSSFVKWRKMVSGGPRPQAAVPAPAVPATAVGPPVVVATVVGSGNDNAQSGAV
ncbi:unnamed protein product [Cladocopium goreaui]|uniref:Serine/threonine-protein kinase H1-like n=1 Tax=Cladocopium goreaui TaxID=2562237 RepID=A0A9P1CAX4_9DINO|nr:unnamed protein product [Cladocopium goreaui]